jgi:ketopantoate reductase
MSSLTNFAIAGPGSVGTLIAEALLAAKAAGHVNQVLVLTRPVRSYCAHTRLHR